MNKYNYRIYVAEEEWIYKLLEITTDENKAYSYANNTNFKKVLIIRHNFELDMDEPISLTFPQQQITRTKRK